MKASNMEKLIFLREFLNKMSTHYIFQLKEFFIFFLLGFIIGIFYGVINLFNKTKPHIIKQILLDSIFTIAFTLFFLFANIKINSFNIRFFLIFAYFLGFVIERISLGKLFAKIVKFMYNILKNLFNKFKRTKVGEFIFK